MTSAFTHAIDVRYGECDQQGIVFNANYLAYVDDAMDHWMRSLELEEWTTGWDVVLKSARVTWHSSARWPERLSLDCGVGRWGSTSFDVVYRLRVQDRPVADAVITYVSIDPGTQRPVSTPEPVRDALGPVVATPESLA
ncbi:MAG: acyl-CoA thioesterase [Microthrixaceae bacterium]